MQNETDPSEAVVETPELDALVLVLNEELELLDRLNFRLTVLRVILLDGNPRFIQAAAHDVEVASVAAVAHEQRTMETIEGARRALGSTTQRVVDLALEAPDTHRKVLIRLTREIERTSRSLASLRDTVRRQSENGRSAMSAVLDLTDSTQANTGPEGRSGQLFRGVI